MTPAQHARETTRLRAVVKRAKAAADKPHLSVGQQMERQAHTGHATMALRQHLTASLK